VPYEFSSELATYTVRRPYGLAGSLDSSSNNNSESERKLFESCCLLSGDEYQNRASASLVASIQVVAVVKADGSPFVLFGNAGVRYKTITNSLGATTSAFINKFDDNDGALEWKQVDDYDSIDLPLGHVVYVDAEANERAYSLDEVLEEALLVREQYCASLTIAASRLRLEEGEEGRRRKASSSLSQDQSTQTEPGATRTGDRATYNGGFRNKSDPDIGLSSYSVAEPLVEVIATLSKGLFYAIWTVFVAAPVRIARAIVFVTIALVVLRAAHLRLADNWHNKQCVLLSQLPNNNNSDRGGTAYFSNRAPGIV